MTLPLAARITLYLWIAWVAYWCLAATRAKQTRDRDTRAATVTVRLLTLLACLMFLTHGPWLGFLRRQFLPHSAGVLWTSLVLTSAGLAFSVWARIVLGGNWSSAVTIQSGHELIRAGPYARIRHPIYTGILCAALGGVLLRADFVGLLGFALFLAAFSFKARREESILAREFGPSLTSYLNDTGMFLPRLR